MLYVKIMSDELLPDTDPNKHYSIIPIQNDETMQFVDIGPIQLESGLPPTGLRQPRFSLLVNGPDGGNETHHLWGNAYVMSESGKTIASHGA